MAGTAGLFGAARLTPSGPASASLPPFTPAAAVGRTLRFSSCRQFTVSPPFQYGWDGRIIRRCAPHPFGAGVAARRSDLLPRSVEPLRFSSCRQFTAVHLFNMAGTAGFEPAHAGIKTPCLTAWRRPSETPHGREFVRPASLQSMAARSGDRFTPRATKLCQLAGTWPATRCASASDSKAANTQAPVPVIRAGENVFNQSRAAATSG